MFNKIILPVWPVLQTIWRFQSSFGCPSWSPCVAIRPFSPHYSRCDEISSEMREPVFVMFTSAPLFSPLVLKSLSFPHLHGPCVPVFPPNISSSILFLISVLNFIALLFFSSIFPPSDKAPGQRECDSSIDNINKCIRDIEQASLAAVSQNLPSRDDISLEVNNRWKWHNIFHRQPPVCCSVCTCLTLSGWWSQLFAFFFLVILISAVRLFFFSSSSLCGAYCVW